MDKARQVPNHQERNNMTSIILSLALSMLNCDAPNVRKANPGYCQCIDIAKRERKLCIEKKGHRCEPEFQQRTKMCKDV